MIDRVTFLGGEELRASSRSSIESARSSVPPISSILVVLSSIMCNTYVCVLGSLTTHRDMWGGELKMSMACCGVLLLLLTSCCYFVVVVVVVVVVMESEPYVERER